MVTHPSTVLTGSAVDNFVDAANNVTVRPNRHSMTEGIKYQTSDQLVVLAVCVIWSPKPLKTLQSSKCDVTIVYGSTFSRSQASVFISDVFRENLPHKKRIYPKIVDITQRCLEAICRGYSASEPTGGANTTFCKLYSRMGRYPSSQCQFSLHQGSLKHQTSLPWVTSVWIYTLCWRLLRLANMTSSTKPEVINTLHCRRKSTDQRPNLTPTENFVKFFGHVTFWDMREDRQTDTLIGILRSPTTTIWRLSELIYIVLCVRSLCWLCLFCGWQYCACVDRVRLCIR